MAAFGLEFERDGNTLKALGFGMDGVCPFSGQVGENADLTSYIYDAEKGELSVTATRRDRKFGSDVEVTIFERSANEDITFSEEAKRGFENNARYFA